MITAPRSIHRAHRQDEVAVRVIPHPTKEIVIPYWLLVMTGVVAVLRVLALLGF